MTRMMVSFMALALLAGCGVTGSLERPQPMWNRDEAVAADNARAAAECQNRSQAQHRVCPASPASTATTAQPSPNQPPGSATSPQ